MVMHVTEQNGIRSAPGGRDEPLTLCASSSTQVVSRPCRSTGCRHVLQLGTGSVWAMGIASRFLENVPLPSNLRQVFDDIAGEELKQADWMAKILGRHGNLFLVGHARLQMADKLYR